MCAEDCPVALRPAAPILLAAHFYRRGCTEVLHLLSRRVGVVACQGPHPSRLWPNFHILVGVEKQPPLLLRILFGNSMKKRSIDPEKKIDQVIRAARRLFVKKGFYAVPIPEIVKESGVSVGAIYLHFGNKENLAAAIYKKTLDDFLEQYNQRLLGQESTRQKLQVFAELVFDITENEPDMIKYMLSVRQCPHPDCAAPLCSTKPFQLVQEFVAAGIAAGEVKAGDHLLAAVSYTGVVLRAVELRLQRVLEQPLPELAGELIDNAWSSIKSG